MKIDTRSTIATCGAADAFGVIERIGGTTGYYYANWLWWSRALLDRLCGGPGMRPGRDDPDHLNAGDVVDCWQVAVCDPHRRLRRESRMRMPGDGCLQFEVEDQGGRVAIRQTATFRPRGMLGGLYWYLLYPVHLIIWSGMLQAIARHAEARARAGADTVTVGHRA